MCILATIILHAGLLASSLSTAACKTCSTDGEHNDVSSVLVYTEPAAAQKARDARLQQGEPSPEQQAAEAKRGAGRVTGEARTFDSDGFSTGAGSLVLASTVGFKATLDDGFSFSVPLSYVRLELDRPSQAGKQPLSALHATVCETITVKGDDGVAKETTACGDAAGTLEFSPDGSGGFDADLVLTAPGTPGDGPSLAGTAHLHHDTFVEHSVCPDVGPVPSGGLQ